MMGTKERAFALLCNRSLETLVPADHFYRDLNAKLDLAFVRDLVRGTHKEGGRPSVDPIVFFKLQLMMLFEGLRSERELVRVAADRLSVRWYLGYDLDEELPDHSSLTRIRKRYGLATFRRFFRCDRPAVPSSWAGLGQRAVLRCHSGERQPIDPVHRATLRGRGTPRRAVHR